MRLFENEHIDFKNLIHKEQLRLSSEEINKKYAKGDIRIVTEQARYPLNTIMNMVESGKYQLNPDFQRRHRWNQVRKSRLIESFIMNVPIPPIFLYEVHYSEYEVMDGLQRLTAIYEFYKDKYRLQGLQEWTEINGLKYSELPELIQQGIDRRYLSSIILLQETAKNKIEARRMKQLVFERLNSGGVKLEPQETRNALHDGPLNQLCIKLASNLYLRKMWGIPEETEDESDEGELQLNDFHSKMEDVELALRFFAYRQVERNEASTLKEFLDYFLEKGNLFDKSLLLQYEKLFEETINLIYTIFKEKAFELYKLRASRWSWYKKPTKVIYDPMMMAFSQYLDQADILIANKEAIIKDIPGFYKQYHGEFEGRNTNKQNIMRRKVLFEEFIRNHLVVDL